MKKLILDIETAPHRVYAWGLWDQNIYIDQIEEPGYTMCWAAKWHGKRGVMFDGLNQSSKEEMIGKIYDLIEEADAVIHYNGTRFDMPTLNQEFVNLGMSRPEPYKQIDMLRVARKQFRLPSNKLDYVARFLEIEGKLQHKGMSLWRDCMAGDVKAWRTMKAYNIQDVNLLEEVYDKLLPWIDGHPNVALYNESTEHACPSCGSHSLQKRGFQRTATMSYQRYQCNSCGSWSRERTNSLDADVKKNLLVQAK